MGHLTSESVNDSVTYCMLYGTLLSVSLLSQMVIRTHSRSLFIQPVVLYIVLRGYCVCVSGLKLFFWHIFNLLFTGDLAVQDIKSHNE